MQSTEEYIIDNKNNETIKFKEAVHFNMAWS